MIDWFKRERPVPYWALCCFAFLTLSGVVQVIGWFT